MVSRVWEIGHTKMRTSKFVGILTLEVHKGTKYFSAAHSLLEMQLRATIMLRKCYPRASACPRVRSVMGTHSARSGETLKIKWEVHQDNRILRLHKYT